ncbi:6152_t:CDS:1, partial [Paraglomus occultum]
MSSYKFYMGKRSETRVLYKAKKLENRYRDLECKIKKAIKDLDTCFEPKTDPE